MQFNELCGCCEENQRQLQAQRIEDLKLFNDICNLVERFYPKVRKAISTAEMRNPDLQQPVDHASSEQ